MCQIQMPSSTVAARHEHGSSASPGKPTVGLAHCTHHVHIHTAPHATQDMNTVAARALACMLLPSNHRPAATTPSHQGSNSAGKPGSMPGSGGRGAVGSRVSPGHHHSPDVRGVSDRLANVQLGGGGGRGGPGLTSRGGGQHAAFAAFSSAPQGPCVGGIGAPGQPVHLLPDLVEQVCSHPLYRMLTLRTLPQVGSKCVWGLGSV